MADITRDYELVVILNPEIGDDAVPYSIQRVEQGITTRGGEVTDSNHWGRRRLAYPIRKQHEGQYILMQTQMTANATQEIERNLRLTEQIIRFQIIRTDV